MHYNCNRCGAALRVPAGVSNRPGLKIRCPGCRDLLLLSEVVTSAMPTMAQPSVGASMHFGGGAGIDVPGIQPPPRMPPPIRPGTRGFEPSPLRPPAPPKAAPPKVAPPKVAPPKVAPPKAAPPASPKVASPKVAPPEVAPPKVAPPTPAATAKASPLGATGPWQIERMSNDRLDLSKLEDMARDGRLRPADRVRQADGAWLAAGELTHLRVSFALRRKEVDKRLHSMARKSKHDCSRGDDEPARYVCTECAYTFCASCAPGKLCPDCKALVATLK